MKGIIVLIAGIIGITSGAIALTSGGPGLFSTVFMVISLIFCVIAMAVGSRALNDKRKFVKITGGIGFILGFFVWVELAIMMITFF